MMELENSSKKNQIHTFPTDWPVSTIDKLSIMVSSGITPTGGSRVYKQEGRPFIRSQNIGWGELLLDNLIYIDDTTHSNFENTEIHANDVFLNISGASIGRSAISNTHLIGGNVNQHVCIIRLDCNKLDPKFLNIFLLSNGGQRQINSFQAGGNRQGLNFKQVRSILVPVPSNKLEQKEIVKVINDIESLLRALKKTIVKKQNLKKAVAEDLLSGHTRLSNSKSQWSIKKLGELGFIYGGLRGKKKTDFKNGNSNYITFLNVINNPVIDINLFEKVNVSDCENQNKVQQGDILFNGSSEIPKEIGMCSLMNSNISNLYLNSFCFGFRPIDKQILDGLFLTYYIRSQLGRELIKSLAQGSTRYNLSKNAFLNLSIKLPIKKEQVIISKALFDMDIEINRLRDRLIKTRNIKKAIIQQLITGKTRLKNLAESDV
ncbi:MAG: restriction endonuclease subunit S [Methylophilaceae bacterium]|nr:restriction endonuclease subunit S [Methylophilaceae bacterium]